MLAKEPLLTLVLMVKDEAHVIQETIATYVHDDDVAFFIFDTGSTDATLEKAQEFFVERSIKNYAFAQEPFIDFATSRNRALDLARQQFPQVPYMIMPDAEWYLNDIEALLGFCLEHLDDQIPCYLLRILSSSLDFYSVRLMKSHYDLFFVGVVHEVLNFGSAYKVPDSIYFRLGNTQVGRDKSAIRWLRDRDLLLKSYHDNPHDPRTVFYLAQTYACLGDFANACKYYEIRTHMQGWSEENFMAYYKLGDAFESRVALEGHKMWQKALDYYLRAYEYRPSRAEPLIRIAQYYLNKQCMALSFLFAQRAAQVPYPQDDVLFVEKYMYDFIRHDILGRCAWYIKEYDSGEAALRLAIKSFPNYTHLQNNLRFYIDRKEKLAFAA